MTAKQTVVADITLLNDKPTKLTFDDLFTWVIWQFPRPKLGGYCGAVRPPLADHGWYPAIIHVEEEKVDVYAHESALYDTPETAAEHFANKGDKL